MHKPDRYSTVSPYLICPSADAVIDFLVAVFDAERLRRFDTEDGRVMHAEVRIDDTVVMMGEAAGEWAPQPAHLHVYLPDVAETWRRAMAAGAEPVQEPEEKPDGDTRGGFKDPGGNTWWIAQAASTSSI